MKQVVQSYGSGLLQLLEVPAPAARPSAVLVQTVSSLVSVGTERYMIDLAKKSLVGKAMARPDLVRQVVDKARTEGLAEAYRQSRGRLDSPVPLGYSAAGIVTAVGSGVTGLAVGDRVACAGSGVACHAEVLRVPQTCAVKVPEAVSCESAAFVALRGIAIHAARTAGLTFGEHVVVLGLGLLGQIAVQVLRAAGCRVCGLDVAPDKVRLAMKHGAHAGSVVGQDYAQSAVRAFSDGRGADAVVIFASTPSNDPIELAAEVARSGARIVVPGLVGLDLPRKAFYEKEIELVVSKAWGPGSDDPEYGAGALDYPVPYVRWSAQRNMAHFLEMLADGSVAVDHLVTHRFPIDRAVEAYETILGGKESTIGVVLTYPGQPTLARTAEVEPAGTSPANGHKVVVSHALGKDLTPRDPVRVGLVGAGLFARGTLLPALQATEGLRLRGVATSTGVTGEHVARTYGLDYCTTDVDELIGDPEIDLVMVLTRHDSHADLVCRALAAGKHVYVEKPLALNESQLERVIAAYRGSPGQLVVGLNRRFAPTTQFAIERLARVGRPFSIAIRVNVGHIPREVWVHYPQQGGGSIVGEVCHFVDLVQALTGSAPASAFARAVRGEGGAVFAEDNVALTLTMADGSTAAIVYTALGDKAFERERVEVFAGGGVCAIENFRSATWSQAGRRQRLRSLLGGVDRGHRAEMRALAAALRQGTAFPVSLQSYVSTTRATFAAMESLRTGRPVDVPVEA